MVGIWVCFEKTLSCILFSLCAPLLEIPSAYPHESGELRFDPRAGAANLHAQPLLGSESWLHMSGLWRLDFNGVAPAYISHVQSKDTYSWIKWTISLRRWLGVRKNFEPVGLQTTMEAANAMDILWDPFSKFVLFFFGVAGFYFVYSPKNRKLERFVYAKVLLGRVQR